MNPSSRWILKLKYYFVFNFLLSVIYVMKIDYGKIFHFGVGNIFFYFYASIKFVGIEYSGASIDIKYK